MENFIPDMSLQEVNRISLLGLAHVGDAVYELMVRSLLCRQGHTAVADLHRLTVSYVKAPAQAQAAQRLLPLLTGEEQDVYRRGRNAKVHTVPPHAELADYHAATGLEALFGWLYLQGKTERLCQLFQAAAEQ